MDGTVAGDERGVRRKIAGTLAREVPAPAPLHFYRTTSMPCPYVEGRVERKLVTELTGPRRDPVLQRTVARRLPPQPSSRLSPGLRRLQRLRAGAHRRSPNSCPAGRCAASPPQRRRDGADRRAERERRAVPAVPALSALAPRRQRHGLDDLWRLSRHDRGQPVATRLVELRGPDAPAVLGACLVDLLDDGLSAVYSFYDPRTNAAASARCSFWRWSTNGAAARPALCLSRLLDRRKSQDGLQVPLPPARRLTAGWTCSPDRQEFGKCCSLESLPPQDDSFGGRSAAAQPLEAAVDPLRVSFSCTPFCPRRWRRPAKSTRSSGWSWLKQENTTVSSPVTGSRCGCRHCAQISFIMHCIGELIDAMAT